MQAISYLILCFRKFSCVSGSLLELLLHAVCMCRYCAVQAVQAVCLRHVLVTAPQASFRTLCWSTSMLQKGDNADGKCGQAVLAFETR